MKEKIIGIFVCMLLIATALPVLGAVNETKNIERATFSIEQISESAEYGVLDGKPIKLLQNQKNTLSGDPVFTGADDQIHPAVVRTESGILGGLFYDMSIKNCSWTYSNDNGKTWTLLISDNISYDYPSTKLWGGDRIFTTAVPSPIAEWGYGGMTLLADTPDMNNPYVVIPYGWWWNSTTPEYNYGFHHMVDCDIACDNSQNYDEYGLLTAIMSKTNDQHDLVNIPFMQYADPDEFPMVWGAWHVSIQNCQHTDAAIDPIKGDTYQWMYGLYDWYDTNSGTWKLIIMYRDFEGLTNKGTQVITGAGNLQCPAVAVNDNNLIILAETDENGNKDIICYYSDNGWQNLQSSFVVSENADEMYPDIRHVKGLKFISTFVKDNALYMTTTEDGGATWSSPELIESNVIEEYKTSDLSEDAMETLYEIDNGDDIDIWMTTNAGQIEMPTWELGDSWTYDTSIYRAASQNVTDDMILDARGKLILKLVNDKGDNYTLSGKMKPLYGKVKLPGVMDFRITRFSSYNSNLVIRKKDMAIVSYESKTKAFLHIMLGPIPLPIPIQMQEYRMTMFDPIWKILPFPLYDGKNGDYDNITMNDDWDISMFWGIVSISSGTGYGGWLGDGPFNCEEESVTVEAGIYDTINVSGTVEFAGMGYDYYYSYYAEEVGNIVKGVYNVDFNNGNTAYLIKFELKSTTY